MKAETIILTYSLHMCTVSIGIVTSNIKLLYEVYNLEQDLNKDSGLFSNTIHYAQLQLLLLN